MNYIAYYRVSTREQGKSGLGLKAQQQTCANFIKEDDRIINEYTEIESGKKDSRPELDKAIREANSRGATLLIARLDRLSRNVSFIFKLRDTAVDFVCCDLPDANTLTIGIFATLAQHERELISKRTRKALEQKKAQGVKLGNPNGWTQQAQRKATETKRRNAKNRDKTAKAKEMILDWIELAKHKKQSLTLQGVADRLNYYGLETPRGKQFTLQNVRYILRQIDQPLPKFNLRIAS